MNFLKNILSKNIQGQKVAVLFIVTNLVYILMVLVTIPKIMNFSNGIKVLDMLPFGYDFEYVNNLFLELGSNGRNFYLYKQIPIDMIYPFLFGITYCLVLAFFLKKINKFDSPLIYLSLLPLIAAFFDYMENFGTINLLNNYPNISELEVKMNSSFTIIKSLTTTAFFIALLIILVFFAIKKIRSHH